MGSGLTTGKTYKEKIVQALNKLADIIDPDGDTNDNILFKDSSDDVIAGSLERIADNYAPPAPELPSVTAEDEGKVLTVDEEGDWVAGSGGGGGVLVVIADEPMASPPSWVTELFDGYRIYETNVTYAQYHEAFTSNVLGLSTPANSEIFNRFRSQMIAEFTDPGFVEEMNAYIAFAMAYKYYGGFIQIELSFIANAEDGMLYCAIESGV